MIPRTKLSKPFAANGDRDDIPSSGDFSLDSGFGAKFSQDIQSGGKFVPRKGFNAILHAVSSHTVFQQQGGEETFDQDYASKIGGYPKGAVLWYDDPRTGFKTRIESLVEGNIYNPEDNSNYVDQKTNANGEIVANGTVKWKTVSTNLKVVNDIESCTVTGVFYFVVEG